MNEKSGDRAQAGLRNNTLVFVDAQMDPCARGLIDICDCAYFVVFVFVICICIRSDNLSEVSTGSVTFVAAQVDPCASGLIDED